MTLTTCNRCGASARILAGGISLLDSNCLRDFYRCEDCGAVTWRDRINHEPRNFLYQIIDKAFGVSFDQSQRGLSDA